MDITPSGDPESLMKSYENLLDPSKTEAEKQAADAIDIDVIIEYYTKDGPLKTAGGNPLIKNKFWDGYLNTATDDGYTAATELKADTNIRNNTNDVIGSVCSDWLNGVEDLTVKVTVLDNGKISSKENQKQ